MSLSELMFFYSVEILYKSDTTIEKIVIKYLVINFLSDN